MKPRNSTLWRVVLYFPAASLITGYIRLSLDSFYNHRVTNPDGSLSLVTDPLREGLVNGGLLLVVLLIGGLLVCRTMTRREIVRSAGLLSAIYLVLRLLGHVFPSLISMLLPGPLFMIFSLFSMVAGYVHQLLPLPLLPTLLGALTPMLLVPFGKKEAN